MGFLMITLEEYKELVAKYNLVPASNIDEVSTYSLPFFPKYGKYQGKSCAIFHDKFGARVCKDLYSWYVWLITKEDFEKSLIEMFKFLKDEQIKEKLNGVRSDFV